MMNLEVAKTRVHCDNCGNEFEAEKPVEEYLGDKCSKCGAILVTQDDIDNLNAITEFANILNSAFGVIPEDEKQIGGKISVNTTTLEVNIKPVT